MNHRVYSRFCCQVIQCMVYYFYTAVGGEEEVTAEHMRGSISELLESSEQSSEGEGLSEEEGKSCRSHPLITM